VSYNYLRSSSVDAAAGGANYNQVGAGADYKLSMSTDVYGAVIYQTANGRDSTGGKAVAALVGESASASSRQTVARVGLRHRF
jgi:predicted porin